MSELPASEALLRILLLALPLALVITLIVLLAANLRARRRPKSTLRAAPSAEPVRSDLAHVPETAALAEARIERHAAPASPLPQGARVGRSSKTQPAPSPLEEDLKPAEITIEQRLEDAELQGNHRELAPLYLALARHKRSRGDEKAALTALRSAAGLAAQYGPKSVHAEARLDLADAAYQAGDLTSACEHWQIARTALYEDGQAAAQAKVDKLMRDHGCPTDWVLTDF